MQHGRAPDSGVAVWQDRIIQVWKHVGGLPFNDKIDDLITAAGFWIVELKTAPLPRLPWKPSGCRDFGLVSCLGTYRDLWACYCSISSRPGRH